MALLKSIALQEEELRRENANDCYAIYEGWQRKRPITMSTEPPPGKPKPDDDAPFRYDCKALPSRDARRHGRWSEY